MITIPFLTYPGNSLIRKLSKPIVLVFFMLIFTPFAISFAQDSTKVVKHTPPAPSSFNTDNIFTGGSIGLSFGTLTFVDISPLIGYNITPKFSAGLGFTYIFYKDNTTAGSHGEFIYGGRTFTRYLLLENIFVHTEYEVLNRKIYDALTRKERRVNVGSFLAGAGYQQAIGINSYVNIMVLWNFNENRYSLYPNPIIRGGVNIGF